MRMVLNVEMNGETIIADNHLSAKFGEHNDTFDDEKTLKFSHNDSFVKNLFKCPVWVKF